MPGLRWYPPSLIDEAALRSAIGGLRRFGGVRYSVATDSTQSRALEILHRLDALGISFVTESQDAGRGRGGRRWCSPPASGLLFSTILPADIRVASLPAVGFWASLCARQSVLNVTGVTLGLKWPNDLLLGDGDVARRATLGDDDVARRATLGDGDVARRATLGDDDDDNVARRAKLGGGAKCGGILADARTLGGTSRVVVGVGLNVNRPAHVPPGIPSGAAWISDSSGRAIDRTALLAEILRTYEGRFDSLVERPADIVAEWWRESALAGKHVRVDALDGTLLHEGDVIGLQSDGALQLRTDDGLVSVTLGDVSVV
jgi:BirA family transcriptional regulator, biotin operon repressor / biotin---[acetyl-CoA-carboxylase] ligase